MKDPIKLRDALRAGIFSNANNPQSSIIEMFGQKVEVRQPSVKAINVMAKRAQESNISSVTQILVNYCFVPGTDEKVFTVEDAEAIDGLPSGKWLTELNEAVANLTGLDLEKAIKNLGKTA